MFRLLFDPFIDVAIAGGLLWAAAQWHNIDHNPETRNALNGAILLFVASLFRLAYVLGGRGINLKLKIDNSEDCLPKSYRKWGDDIAKHRRFVRMKTYNKSHNVAKNVAVKLLSLSQRCGMSNIRLDYSNPQFLRWNGEGRPGEYQKKNMPHGGPEYVDVLFTELHEGKVRVVMTDVPYTPIGLTTNCTYKFVVQATAEEATAATTVFYVWLGSTYDAITIYRFGWMATFASRGLTAHQRNPPQP
jgi:hypothetical protein